MLWIPKFRKISKVETILVTQITNKIPPSFSRLGDSFFTTGTSLAIKIPIQDVG